MGNPASETLRMLPSAPTGNTAHIGRIESIITSLVMRIADLEGRLSKLEQKVEKI
jgi:hypothetical protein